MRCLVVKSKLMSLYHATNLIGILKKPSYSRSLTSNKHQNFGNKKGGCERLASIFPVLDVAIIYKKFNVEVTQTFWKQKRGVPTTSLFDGI
jgi:hypothetical protein